jgi:hypothetical protein
MIKIFFSKNVIKYLISIEHYRTSWKRGSLFKTYVGGQCLENHLQHLHVVTFVGATPFALFTRAHSFHIFEAS